jgi:hypothetical protein
MTELLKKILKVLIIIVILVIIFAITNNYYSLKIEGYKNIGEPNNAIKNEKLKNISIMASYDTALLNGNASMKNIEDVLKTGCRWLDFEVNETPIKPNYPVVSSSLSLKDVLNEVKKTNSQSPASKTPLFINLRVSGSHEETFYNIIHNTILYNDESNKDGVFTENELYQKPGPMKTLLSDVKEKVLGIVDNYKTKFKNESEKIETEEGFGVMNHLGTENELYENFTFLDAIYNINAKSNIEGFTINDDNIDTDIKTTEEKIASLIQKQKAIEKTIKEASEKINSKTSIIRLQALKTTKIFKEQLSKTKEELKEQEDILTKLTNRKEEIENKTLNAELDGVKKEQRIAEANTANDNADYEEKMQNATEPVAGAGKHAQELIDKLRTDVSSKELDIAKMTNEINTLKQDNVEYRKLVKNTNNNFIDLNAEVSNNMTKKTQCARCINGETLLQEIEDKIVIVISRNSNTVDGYNSSKLASDKDSIVNIEINDYKPNDNSSNDEKVSSIPYNKNDFQHSTANNSMLVTSLGNSIVNFDMALKNSISNKKIQVVKVSNLVNRTSYLDMYSNYNSSFIVMSDAIKYVNK